MFFFNPLTFQKVIGIDRPWYEYRKPLYVEYEYWNTPKPKNICSYEEQEIKFIFKELNRSEEVDSEQYFGGGRRLVWFFIRRLSDTDIILVVDVTSNKTAQIGDNKYVRITDELWNYLLQVQQREENASDVRK